MLEISIRIRAWYKAQRENWKLKIEKNSAEIIEKSEGSLCFMAKSSSEKDTAVSTEESSSLLEPSVYIEISLLIRGIEN